MSDCFFRHCLFLRIAEPAACICGLQRTDWDSRPLPVGRSHRLYPQRPHARHRAVSHPPKRKNKFSPPYSGIAVNAAGICRRHRPCLQCDRPRYQGRSSHTCRTAPLRVRPIPHPSSGPEKLLAAVGSLRG